MKKTLTLQQTADRLGVARETVRKGYQALGGIRMGDRIVFSAQAVDNFVATGSVSGSAGASPSHEDEQRSARLFARKVLELQQAAIEFQLEALDREENDGLPAGHTLIARIGRKRTQQG